MATNLPIKEASVCVDEALEVGAEVVMAVSDGRGLALGLLI